MKSHLVFLFVVASLFGPPVAHSAPEDYRDPEDYRGAPAPKFSVAQAVEKVSKYVRDHRADTDASIVSVVYGRPDKLGLTEGHSPTNTSVQDAEEERSWFVTFWNPHGFPSLRVYRLKDSGVVEPLGHIQL